MVATALGKGKGMVPGKTDGGCNVSGIAAAGNEQGTSGNRAVPHHAGGVKEGLVKSRTSPRSCARKVSTVSVGKLGAGLLHGNCLLVGDKE